MTSRKLTHEQIANTEKKLDMPLDDIIKMSKNNTVNSKKKQRFSNKGQKQFNNYSNGKALRVRQFIDSKPYLRQGALAQRRSKFGGDQFLVTTSFAQKAAVASFHDRPYQRYGVTKLNKNSLRSSIANKGRVTNAGFVSKPKNQQRFGDTLQRPKTLDALFASMKEERMRAFGGHNNSRQLNNNSVRRGAAYWPKGGFATNISGSN